MIHVTLTMVVGLELELELELEASVTGFVECHYGEEEGEEVVVMVRSRT